MTSVKIRASWTDENVVTEGVRIYKSDQEFDVNTRPLPLVELTNNEEFYEDFDVEENETVYYMLSCFLGEQEVFTECYEIVAQAAAKYALLSLNGGMWNAGLTSVGTSITVAEKVTEPNSVNILIVNAPGVVLNVPGWTYFTSLNNKQYYYRIGSVLNRTTIITSDLARYLGYALFNLKANTPIVDVELKIATASYDNPSIGTTVSPVFPLVVDPINADSFFAHYWMQGGTDGRQVTQNTPATYTKLPSMGYPNASVPYSTGFSGFGKSVLAGQQVQVTGQFLNVYSGVYWCHTLQICAKS